MAVRRTRPLRVAVLCSQRAPGLVHLLNADPRRGTEFEVVCCLTSNETFAEEVRVERRGVPCVAHPVREFYRERNARLPDLQTRVDYDTVTLQLLAPHRPDLLILAGYLLVLTEPVLETFEGRILNVHHSDLAQRDASGGPRYPGLRAVRDALFAGERETRATVHVVTPRLDDGPVLLRSWPFPVPEIARWALENGAPDALRAYAWAHQEWMLRTAWGPLLSRAIELAATGMATPDAPLEMEAMGQWVLGEHGLLVAEEQAGVS
jgi:phosphoribosylglycinamide formyltransferase 1